MSATDAISETSPNSPRVSVREAAIAAIGGLSILIALAVGPWRRSDGESGVLTVLNPAQARASLEGSPYVGSAACGRCHPGEAAAYSRSGHSQTLGPAATSAVARALIGKSKADPERPGVVWKYVLKDGSLVAERTDSGVGSTEQFVLEYLFGSGRHAGTFVTISDPKAPTATEHRLTYFAKPDDLEVTPGQGAAKPAEGTTLSGRSLSSKETLKCFGCHSSPAGRHMETAPGQAPLPDSGPMIPNVSCERCHGPGRAHAEAARRGRTVRLSTAASPRDSRHYAASQLGLCGQCHRHPSRFPKERIRSDDPELARFQPIGLSQSKCYVKSDGALGCAFCHDPHAGAVSDREAYAADCLACHDASGEDPKLPPCPVSPRNGCVGCHMPKIDSGQNVLFTDHWIRVREKPAEEAR